MEGSRKSGNIAFRGYKGIVLSYSLLRASKFLRGLGYEGLGCQLRSS